MLPKYEAKEMLNDLEVANHLIFKVEQQNRKDGFNDVLHLLYMIRIDLGVARQSFVKERKNEFPI